MPASVQGGKGLRQQQPLLAGGKNLLACYSECF